MKWVVGASAVFFFIAIVALALGGAEPPSTIQTFTHSSRAERDFDNHAVRLRMIGFASLGVAVLLSVIAGTLLLR